MSLSRSNTYSWGCDKVLSRKSPWNDCNLYLYSSGSAVKRSNEKRYQLAKTIPGTQRYHYFEALQDHKIAMKRISNDADFAFIYSYFSYPTHINVSLANYITCKYVDGTVWIGNVLDVNECEVEVKFLHPRFPAATYYWPQ